MKKKMSGLTNSDMDETQFDPIEAKIKNESPTCLDDKHFDSLNVNTVKLGGKDVQESSSEKHILWSVPKVKISANKKKIIVEIVKKDIHKNISVNKAEKEGCSILSKKRRTHDINRMKSTCKFCNKTFEDKSKLDRHMVVHTGIKPFSCDICNKKFSRKEILNNHMITHFDEKLYECDLCKKAFKHKITLDKHKLEHTGVLPYSCDVCYKQFKTKFDYTRHVVLHTGEKPYVCDVCQQAFARKDTLLEHKNIHTGDKPYSCTTCEATFAQKAGLYKHRRKQQH